MREKGDCLVWISSKKYLHNQGCRCIIYSTSWLLLKLEEEEEKEKEVEVEVEEEEEEDIEHENQYRVLSLTV